MAEAAPYLMVGAIGLIGQWLMGNKGGANAQKPQDMPNINQALRGTPIYVSFGAVRVSAQVTWTKNWTATRMKGGGKGAAKGGGSAGGGSAKGAGSAGQGYTYSWDIMFNFGIVDVPVVVTKAWIGADRVDDAQVVSWNTQIDPSGLAGLFTALGAGTAKLDATETFFSPGWNTGDVELTTWPYFQAQEGLACAWPSTSYIGFNQLQLGSTPSVPQLSVELVPSGTTFAVNGAVYDDPISNADSAPSPGSQPYCKDGFNGDLWALRMHDNNADLHIHRLIDDHEIVILNATIKNDFGVVSGLTYDGSLRFPTSVTPCPGTPYFYITWCDIHFPTTADAIWALLYHIDDASTVTLVGSRRMWYGAGVGLSNNYPNGHAAFTLNNGEVLTFSSGRSSNTKTYIVTLPAPADVTGLFIDSGLGSHEMEGRTYQMTEVGNQFLDANSNGRTVVIGCAAHHAVGALLYFYIPKGRCTYELANTQNAYIKTAAATYPNGFMATLDFTNIALSYPLTINNNFFTNGGLPVVPFADAGLNSAGAAGTYYDDWSAIAATGTGKIVMMRSYSDKPWNAKMVAFDTTGAQIASAQADFSTVGVFGSTENLLMDMFIDTTGDVWFETDRADTGFQNRWHVHYGAFSDFSADVTPPYIIKRILTSAVFGFATQSLFGFTITDDTIDAGSYNDAVQKCQDENVFVSVSYTSQDALLTTLNDLLALYGGTLAEHGGKIYFDVFRADDIPVRTIDNDHLIITADGEPPVQVVKGAVQDGFNSVQYQYIDRKLDYKQNQVNLSDEVDIDTNGYRNKVYPSRFIMTGSLASQVAERALWSNMYGRDNYSFKLGWKDADLRPGNQVTLVDSWHPALQAGVRVVINKSQESERGIFSIEATRVFANHLTAAHGYTTTASVDPGIDSILVAAGPMLDFRAYELPQEFQGSTGFTYFGYNQSTYIMGAQLFLSRDLGANYILTQDVQPFAISGTLAQGLPARDPGFVETDAKIWLFPTSGFNTNTPTFVSTYTLDDATPAVRQTGLSTIVVGSEAIGLEGLTLLSQNYYKVSKMYRGWGGTPISSQSSGAYWCEHQSGIFSWPITQDDIGASIFYKVVPYNFAGHAYNISSIAAKQYTIKGLRWLPRCQAPLRTFVQSAISWPAASDFRGDYLSVTSGGCDTTLGWPPSANAEGFGQGGAGANGFGHFTPDAGTPSYRIDVRSSDGTKVSSFVANTGYFNYSVAQNSADFGGFARDVIYQVTPFNSLGDGPTSSTRTLHLFW